MTLSLHHWSILNFGQRSLEQRSRGHAKFWLLEMLYIFKRYVYVELNLVVLTSDEVARWFKTINIQYWCIDGRYRIYVARLINGGKDEL